jgi:SAM-dependent methyltransferase
MTQITSGVRAILSHSTIYSALQTMMGAHKGRVNFVANFVKPYAEMKVLDIGCGPADILAYLPGVDYWGFDISEDYINQARKRFGTRGKFECRHLIDKDLENLPMFDVVLAIGLIHHLDDPVATEVLQLAFQALKPGGKLLTIDPCLDPSQSRIARFLIRNDRGQNVRDKAGYESLAKGVFESPRLDVQHKAWIPYTHCYMECHK